MKLQISLGTKNDILELEKLYDYTNDYLADNINYPGWIKGIYPTAETAISAAASSALFTAKVDDVIVASVILNHQQEEAYKHAVWGIETEDTNILVVHTLVVNPKYKNQGLGKQLLDFTKEYAKSKYIKSIRLDVSIHNKPAIKLYESSCFQYIDTVDLGLEYPDLKWFYLYEYLL